MPTEQIDLTFLMQHIAHCPIDYLLPVVTRTDAVYNLNKSNKSDSNLECLFLPALIGDTLLAHGFKLKQNYDKYFSENKSQNSLRLCSLLCYILQCDVFTGLILSEDIILVLTTGALDSLAEVVNPESFVDDTERREELARIIIREIGLCPAGESKSQAQERLLMLDTLEREKVIQQTRLAVIRAQKLKEEMERKRAAEAASKMSYE